LATIGWIRDPRKDKREGEAKRKVEEERMTGEEPEGDKMTGTREPLLATKREAMRATEGEAKREKREGVGEEDLIGETKRRGSKTIGSEKGI
jgi:hypothetical protein